MANLKDKTTQRKAVKNTETIKDTVAFSGTDIHVVAYRQATPASKFRVHQLNQEIEKEEIEISRNRKRKVEASAAFEGALSDLQATRAQLQERAEQLRASNVGDLATSMGRLNDKEGRFEKKLRDAVATEARVSGDLIDAEGRRDRLQGELKHLVGEKSHFDLGSIHTLSYSSFREKFAVRTIGRTQAKTYTRGPRTIAGKLCLRYLWVSMHS